MCSKELSPSLQQPLESVQFDRAIQSFLNCSDKNLLDFQQFLSAAANICNKQNIQNILQIYR